MSDIGKKALFLSGGSTKFVGLASAAIRLYQLGYRPDIIGGVSAGSIVTLPLVLGYHDKLLEIGVNLDFKSMFEIPPLNKKGKITIKSAFRMLFGKNSLGIQNLKPIISSIITEEDFKRYQLEDHPVIYILAVNPTDGSRKLWNLKDENINYEKYLKIISASSQIPVVTQPEYIDGEYYYDGGIRNHTPSTKILSIRDDISKFISIYSRPKDFRKIDTSWDKNVFKVLMRTTQIMTFEISKRDEEMERLIAENKNIEFKQLFLPTVLNSMFDTNPNLLQIILKEGVDVVDCNIGDFIN